MMTILQLHKKIEVIPPFASSLMRLSDLIMSGAYTLEDVVKVVKLDQGLTLDVIAYANSAESAAISEITTVQAAIVRMGGARLLRYLLSKWFRGNVTSALGSDPNAFGLWLHGVNSAIVSDQLAIISPAIANPLGFTACLLHDIGRVPLALWAAENHVVYDWSINDLANVTSEQETFGFDHGYVGALILERWKFPKEIINAVQNHCGQTAAHTQLADQIFIANKVCRSLEDNHSFNTDNVLMHYGINELMWNELLQKTSIQSKEVMSEFGIG